MTLLNSTQGDAVNQLYLNNHSWLTNWLRARMDCTHQAEDLSQDTFVRILNNEKSLQQLVNVLQPRSYLATIAKRLLIDHYRRQSVEQAYLQAAAQQPEEVEISAESQLLMIEALVELDNMLDGLGYKVKKAFWLNQLEGLPYSEIAKQLSVSVSSVKKYMAKATEQYLLFSLQQTEFN